MHQMCAEEHHRNDVEEGNDRPLEAGDEVFIGEIAGLTTDGLGISETVGARLAEGQIEDVKDHKRTNDDAANRHCSGGE